MNILFVNPPTPKGRKVMRNFDCTTESKGNYLYQPYDFLLLSSSVPDDSFFDFYDFSALESTISKEMALEKIERFSPHIVVLAIADSLWSHDVNFLKKLRQRLPKTFLLVFGDSFTEDYAVEKIHSFADGVLSSALGFDFKAYMEGGHVDGLRVSGDKAFSGDKTPLEVEVGIPKHHKFLNGLYRWPFTKHKIYTTIFTSWGCPYSCGYCVVGSFPNYHRPWQEVIHEMNEVKRLGVKEIYIGDRSFGLPYKNVLKILHEMRRRKFEFKWSTYFHPNQYTPELLEHMKASGCHTIVTGIESYKQESVKHFGRHVRKGQLMKMLDHAREIDMNVCGDFIIGLPGEDRKDIKKTIRWAVSLPLDYASFNIATPLPGTKLRKEGIENGKLNEDTRHFDSSGYTNIMPSDKLSVEELRRLRRMAVSRFYGRPTYWIRRMLKTETPVEFHIQINEMFGLIKNFLR